MTSTPTPGSTLQLCALILLGVSGANSLGILPVLVGAFVDHGGFTLATAGLLVSIELTAMLAGNAALLGPLRGLPVRRIAAGALGLIVLGNLLAAGADGLPAHAACRVIAGLGEGCTIAFAGQLAQRVNADRDFAIYTAAILVAGALNLQLAPALLERFGVAGLLGLLAAYAIGGLVLLRWLPNRLHAPRAVETGTRVPLRMDALALVLVLYVGLASLWTLVGRFGVGAGLDAGDVSRIIGRAFLVAGLAGAALAPLLARRFGNAPVVAAMVIGMIAAGVALSMQSGAAAFTLATAAFVFAWFTCFPNVMGLLAKLDPAGGLAVAGMLVQTLGFAISPAFSAWLIGAITLPGAGWVAISFLGASLVLLALVVRRAAVAAPS
jgi:predicted MFS family arabinose efflux permease